MLSRLCILFVLLWLAPPLLVSPKAAYRKYKQSQSVRVHMFGLWLRLIIQEEEEQKLGIEIPEQ